MTTSREWKNLQTAGTWGDSCQILRACRGEGRSWIGQHCSTGFMGNHYSSSSHKSERSKEGGQRA